MHRTHQRNWNKRDHIERGFHQPIPCPDGRMYKFVRNFVLILFVPAVTISCKPYCFRLSYGFQQMKRILNRTAALTRECLAGSQCDPIAS